MTATPTVAILSLSRPRSAGRVVLVVALSLLLVSPCWLQKRIMAGDLSSHIYNAWLATLIEKGQAPGLVIRPMFTNVGFDLMLEYLLKVFGPDLAQRIAASAVVLVFVVGAFLFICRVSRRRPWFLLPQIAMLAYGWTFHMGFFNFEASLGFSLAALSVAPDRWRRIGLIAVLLALALVFHAHPVILAVGLGAYQFLAGLMRPRWRPLLFAAAMGALILARVILASRVRCVWVSGAYNPLSTGCDQLWTHGNLSRLFASSLLVLWLLIAVRMWNQVSPLRFALTASHHMPLLVAFAIVILPEAIYTAPGKHGFWYIPERTSLLLAISVLAVLGRARPTPLVSMAGGLLGVLFFWHLCAQSAALNAVEDKIDAAVLRLPPGVRVTAPIQQPGRINQALHMIDRACVGRCFSYANYEASSGHFRIRLAGESPLVAHNYDASFALQQGAYKPAPTDLPFYEIRPCEDGRLLCTHYIGAAIPGGAIAVPGMQ